MSQFNKARESGFRRRLLTTVSIFALISTASGVEVARAADSDRPLLWIDLGAQISRLGQDEETFAPALFDARPSIFTPSQKFERSALYGIDRAGAISFQPEDSDWMFSASIRYGRSTAKRHVRQQTTPEPFVKYYTDYNGVRHKNVAYASGAKFADTNVQNSERHMVVDFQAGKDVGLGMLGSRNGSSAISLGVRFAQFKSKSNIALKSDPDWHFYTKYFYGRKVALGGIYHSNAATLHADRSFRGVGPSLSWSASTPLVGNARDSELTFDWGLNAAVLFGKQRAQVHHQTTARYHPKYPVNHGFVVGTPVNTNHTRARSVAVPDIGGFAGLSLRYADAKISLGYRADLFLNAIDGGIDARKAENRSFYGPFASISVGLGD